MVVVEMHGQLFGPFATAAEAFAWIDRFSDPKDPPGKRALVRTLHIP